MTSRSLHGCQAGSSRTSLSSLPRFSARVPSCCCMQSGMRRALTSQARRCTHVALVLKAQTGFSGSSSISDSVPQKFIGVWKLSSGRYAVRITVDGVTRHMGVLHSREEAARHRDMLIIRFFGSNGTITQALPYIKLNYPLSEYKQEDVMALKSLEQYKKNWAAKQASGLPTKRHKTKQSLFYGVYWNKSCQKCHARVRVPGKLVLVGFYPTEEEARRKYDEMAYRLLGDQAVLNFPQDIEQCKAAAAKPARVLGKKKSSQYLGVYYHRRNSRWVAQLRHGGKQVFYAYYDTEEEAARAFDQAVMLQLPEVEWASKLNFKDSLNRRPPTTSV